MHACMHVAMCMHALQSNIKALPGGYVIVVTWARGICLIGNLSFHNDLCGDVTDFLVLCAYA